VSPEKAAVALNSYVDPETSYVLQDLLYTKFIENIATKKLTSADIINKMAQELKLIIDRNYPKCY